MVFLLCPPVFISILQCHESNIFQISIRFKEANCAWNKFNYEDLEETFAVKQGSFGVVFKATSMVRGCVSDTVVGKKLLLEGEEDQKEFIKEARMLHHIKHDNIVNFRALCQLLFAIML